MQADGELQRTASPSDISDPGWTEWFTVRDVGLLLKIRPDTVRRWIRNKRLRAKFFGGRTGYRIQRDDLQRFLYQGQEEMLEPPRETESMGVRSQ